MKNVLKCYLKRWSLVHRYYKITRFYSFLKNTAYQAFFIIVIFVLLLMAVNFLIIDLNLLIDHIIERYSPKIIILCFLISESILGLIPPEIFILWSSKSGSPILFLFALATVSYIGGVVSYFIGVCISMMPAVRKHLEQKINKKYKKKKIGAARLKHTRYDNSKGTRIGPSLFYTSELHSKYIKLIAISISY